MIIWKGLGLAVPLAGLLLGFGGMALGYAIEPGSARLARIGLALGGLAAGAVVFLVANRVARPPGRPAGTFFFIPTKFWAGILPAATAAVAVWGNVAPTAAAFWAEAVG